VRGHRDPALRGRQAGFAIVASGLRQCLIESDGKQTLHVRKLEKIFLSLA